MQISIVMGSDSDMPIVDKITSILDEFSVSYEKRILSAHRTPAQLHDYISIAQEKGIQVFIGVAGKAAHLPGVMASLTTLPVIGVPIKTDMMGGMDSLLSIVQMPKGIPVATVGVNAGENAGLLAISILSVADKDMEKKLVEYRKKMSKDVLQKDAKL